MISSFKHVYDVDAMSIYWQIVNRYHESDEIQPYLEHLRDEINKIIIKQGIRNDLAWQYRAALVVDPGEDIDQYNMWMHLMLYLQPINRIKLVLDYHERNWNLGQDFRNNLQFQILNRMESNGYLFDQTKIDQVSNYILLERLSSTESNHNLEDVKLDTNLKDRISCSNETKERLIAYFTNYLVDTNLDSLTNVIYGKSIQGCVKLSVSRIAFIYLFYELQKEEIIYNFNKTSIRNWIVCNFQFLSPENPKYSNPGKSYVDKVLEGKRLPKKSSIPIEQFKK